MSRHLRGIVTRHSIHSPFSSFASLIIAGGEDASAMYSGIWMFSPAANEWSPVSVVGPVPLPRSQHLAFARAGLMYIVGGRSSKSWVNGADAWSIFDERE
jgi:hypothetical protein